MTATINIPTGWRRLRDEEVVARGDRLLSDPGNEPNIDSWDRANATVGNRVAMFSLGRTVFIRHEPEPEPTPAPEKEWLNPWE